MTGAIAFLIFIAAGLALVCFFIAPIWHAWKTRKRDMAVYRPSSYFQSGRIIK